MGSCYQYITFNRVFDEQQTLYPGDREKIVQETIRVCRDKNVLKDYLARVEAAAIMFTIADQAGTMKETLEMEKPEGLAKGEAVGIMKGESRFVALMKKFLSLGRMEILQRTAVNQKYWGNLYAKFNIR